MVIDNAFGVAGSARGVVERNRIPLIVRFVPLKFAITVSDKFFVFGAAYTNSSAGVFAVVDS